MEGFAFVRLLKERSSVPSLYLFFLFLFLFSPLRWVGRRELGSAEIHLNPFD